MEELAKLRAQINNIDDEIISLLKQRVKIVRRVGNIKKESSTSQSFIRAGREAKMLRDLTKKANGIFPPEAIATMWRMIISTSLSIEQEIILHIYKVHNNNCFWLAREYFGTFLQIKQHTNPQSLIKEVAKNSAAVGILPFIDKSAKPWWLRPKNEKNNIYVFAKIPFIEEASLPSALAIANTIPETTKDDVSIFVINTNKPKKKVVEIFTRYNMHTKIISKKGNNILLSTDNFVAIGDIKVKQIEADLGKDSTARLMGSYAATIAK